MRRSRYLVIAALLSAECAFAALPKPYDLLSRKSIFARDRVSRQPGTFVSGPSTAPAPRPSVPVLIGIVLEEDGCVAVLETGSGRINDLRPGQTIPDTQAIVTEIALDYIELYTPGADALRRVLIGQNIEGATVSVAPASATTSTTNEAPIEGDDVISRMRRRRQQESSR